MKKQGKKREKTYFIGYIKANNKVVLCTTKVELAHFVSKSVDTIRRNLLISSPFEAKEYIIWQNIPLKKAKKGFAI